MISKKQVEKIAKKEVARGRFDGTVNVNETSDKPCFSAGIDKERLRDISIGYNPEYEEEHPGKTEVVIRDIARHEINHKQYAGFNGCPRTLDNHVELIFEPMSEVLKQKGHNRQDAHYIANALEDTILHADLAKKFSLEGINHFFEDVGRNMEVPQMEKNVNQKGKKYTDFYEAHVKLNLLLWGTKQQKAEVKKYFKHSEKVKEVLEKFIERTGLSRLNQEIEVNGKTIEVKDLQKIRQYLTNESNWSRISTIYAEEFSKLMQPGYSMPLPNHSGKGTSGNPKPGQGEPQDGEDEKQKGEGKENQNKPGQGNEEKTNPRDIEGNVFDKEMYTEEYKKSRVNKAYNSGKEAPAWIDAFEAMDLVYQSLARKLNIKAETFTNQTAMPINWYGKRDFDPDRDNLKHVKFDFDDKGKVELKKKRWHDDIPLEYKVNPKGFPEVRFCMLDTSSSMLSAPEGGDSGRKNIIPWGDKSKYHYALLGWYGLIEYLKQNHLLKQQTIGLGNFSNQTYLGQGLQEAKRVALSPQFGGTELDLDKIKKIFKDRGMLVFTLSDGGIENWSSIKDDFIKMAKEHHYFHLQIGGANGMTQDLEAAGLKVEYIKGEKDLSNRVIDLTDKLYRGPK